MDYRTLGKLERGNTRLRQDHIDKLAPVFHVEPAELLGDGKALTAAERKLVLLFRQLSTGDREKALAIIAIMVPDEHGSQAPPNPTERGGGSKAA